MGDEGGAPTLGSFVIKETGRECSAIFVPDGWRLDAPKLKSLFSEQWQLEVGMLVSFDAGAVHPKQFAAPALVQLQQFAQMWDDAQKHAARSSGGAGDDGVALGIINDVLFMKLTTIVASILDACLRRMNECVWLRGVDRR